MDCYGNLTSILAVSDYAKAYREKHRRHCRESYARKKEKEAEPPQISFDDLLGGVC